MATGISSWGLIIVFVFLSLLYHEVRCSKEYPKDLSESLERRLFGICLDHADDERSTLYSWCAGKSFTNRDVKSTTSAAGTTFKFIRREKAITSDRLDEIFVGSSRSSKGRNLTVSLLCCEGIRKYDIQMRSVFDPADASRSLNITICAQPLCDVLVPTKLPETEIKSLRLPMGPINKREQLELRERTRDMFIKAYDSYMNLAFPMVRIFQSLSP